MTQSLRFRPCSAVRTASAATPTSVTQLQWLKSSHVSRDVDACVHNIDQGLAEGSNSLDRAVDACGWGIRWGSREVPARAGFAQHRRLGDGTDAADPTGGAVRSTFAASGPDGSEQAGRDDGGPLQWGSQQALLALHGTVRSATATHACRQGMVVRWAEHGGISERRSARRTASTRRWMSRRRSLPSRLRHRRRGRPPSEYMPARLALLYTRCI